MHWRRKWQPTPVFLPGVSQGWGSLVAAVYGVTQSRTRLKRFSSSSRNNPSIQTSPLNRLLFSRGFEKPLGDTKVFQNIILNISLTGPQTTLPIVFFGSEQGTPLSPGLLPRPSLPSFWPHLPLWQACTVPSGPQH